MPRPRNLESKALLQGQLTSVPELIVSRESKPGMVIYRMPNQVTIMAVANGVSISGSSVCMGPKPLIGFLRVLKWADKCHQNLASGVVPPKQEEFDGTLRLRTIQFEPDNWMAYYVGHLTQRFKGESKAAAISALRSGYVHQNGSLPGAVGAAPVSS